MNATEQLTAIAEKEVAATATIKQLAVKERRLNELQAERKRIAGMAFAEGKEPATAEIDERISKALGSIEAGRQDAETAQAALEILAKKRDAANALLAEEKEADRANRIAKALEMRDAVKAELREKIAALVDTICVLKGIRKALVSLESAHDVEPVWRLSQDINHWNQLYPDYCNVDWGYGDSYEPRKAEDVCHALTGIPIYTANKSTTEDRTPPAAPVVEVVGFSLPDSIEDPEPDLGWPEERSTMLEWALAFAGRSWKVAPCTINEHGEVVPIIEGGFLGQPSFTSDPKSIRRLWEDRQTAPVCFIAVGRRWIFDKGRIKKFVPVDRLGRR